MLGFVGLGSAASQDPDPTAHPLQDYNDPSLIYTGNVEYGWSNPQVLSVMPSSPYRDELNYGAIIKQPLSIFNNNSTLRLRKNCDILKKTIPLRREMLEHDPRFRCRHECTRR